MAIASSQEAQRQRRQCVLHGIAGRRDTRVLGRTTTYFARNLAHDLSCSFTNALPFEERSRSGGPKGSQACCGCTRWPLENWCVAAQFLALSWRKRAASSSREETSLQRAGNPRVGGGCVHKHNVTCYCRLYVHGMRHMHVKNTQSQHLNGLQAAIIGSKTPTSTSLRTAW